MRAMMESKNQFEIDIQKIVEIAEQAGEIIMDYYVQDVEVISKEDQSPVTAADFAASRFIVDSLHELYPQIPALSEESESDVFEQRKSWEDFFLIDPLDGTKEFIKKSDEFTVNIAFITNKVSELGVIHLPAQGITYYGDSSRSFKRVMKGKDKDQKVTQLPMESFREGQLRVMISKSHMNEMTQNYVEELKKDYAVTYDKVGSSIKICMVAEGIADLNPRLGVGTKEWDIAAGHAIVKGAGGEIHVMGSLEPVPYNKESLFNPEYEVKRKELVGILLNSKR